MMKYFPTIAIVMCLLVNGCSTQQRGSNAQSDAFANPKYTYQPIGPYAVWITAANEAAHLAPEDYRQSLLADLDSEASRVAMYRFAADGSISLLPLTGTIAGERYSLVIDYIKCVTYAKPVVITRSTECCGRTIIRAFRKSDCKNKSDQKIVFDGAVPIYIGLGLRIQADYRALEGGIDIAGLPGLAAAAQANSISGSLIVQTLGVGGEEISPLMPMPSDLSVASIQSATQAAASIKVKLYDNSTIVQPVIVGFESPIQDNQVITQLTSLIAGLNYKIHLKLQDRSQVGKKDRPYFEWPDWHKSSKGDCNKSCN